MISFDQTNQFSESIGQKNSLLEDMQIKIKLAKDFVRTKANQTPGQESPNLRKNKQDSQVTRKRSNMVRKENQSSDQNKVHRKKSPSKKQKQGNSQSNNRQQFHTVKSKNSQINGEDLDDYQSYNINNPKVQTQQHFQSVISANSQNDKKQYYDSLLFKGKVWNVWLFIIKEISIENKRQIFELYKDFYEANNYKIPFCSSLTEALPFFQAQNAFFKIICDRHNIEELLKARQIQQKINQIYIYNVDNINRSKRLLNLKKDRRVKQIHGCLKQFLKMVEKDVQNCLKFQQTEDGELAQFKGGRQGSQFPSYIKLTGQDKTQITDYRRNLYGCIKMTDKQYRENTLDDFKRIAKIVSVGIDDFNDQWIRYIKDIDHFDCDPNNQIKHRKVIRFYVEDNFYYRTVNNLLRQCRNIEQFKPLTVPFNETYHAIKYYFEDSIRKNKIPNQSFKLYRRTFFKGQQLIKQGDYIELLGFISTASQIQGTERFNYRGTILIVFQINKSPLWEKYSHLNHGFVQLSNYGLAPDGYQNQKEVLINALNVFKVTNIVKTQKNQVQTIYLEYGSIFQLYEQQIQKKLDFIDPRFGVLKNHQACAKLLRQIQDQSDVYLHAQEYDKCVQIIQKQMQKDPEDITKLLKLATVQHLSGDTDKALLNVDKFIQKINQVPQQTKKENVQKIIQNHEQIMEIFSQKEDTLAAQQTIDLEIQFIETPDSFLLRAEKMREKGQLYLIQGQFDQAFKTLEESQNIILDKINSFDSKEKRLQRDNQNRDSFFHKMLCCVRQQFQTQEQIQAQLKKNKEQKEQFERLYKSDSYKQLLKINRSMLTYFEKVKNKQLYKKCALQGEQYMRIFKQISPERQQSKIEIIQIQSQLLHSSEQVQKVEQSFKKLQQVLQKQEQTNSMSPQVGQISKACAILKMKQFNNYLVMPAPIQQKSERNAQEPQPQSAQQKPQFDHLKHNIMFVQTKQYLQKSETVIAYNKKEDHPDVLEIKNILGNLYYEYQKLIEALSQAQMVINLGAAKKHTQVSLAYVLKARIHLLRGQISTAFKSIEESYKVLRAALVKKEDKKYEKLLNSSPIYIKITLCKAKIYNRQLNHDLALNSINEIKDIVKKKLTNADGVGYLADIYAELGNTYALKKKCVKFEEYYLKAINSRTIQRGGKNIQNATIYCSLAKYLAYFDDIDDANYYLEQSFRIFSGYQRNHPLSWILFATMSIINEKKNDLNGQIEDLSQSIKLMSLKQNKNDINFIKMKTRYAELLMENNKVQQAQKQFCELDQILENDEQLKQFEDSSKQSEKQMMTKTKKVENEKVYIRDQVRKSLVIAKSVSRMNKTAFTQNQTSIKQQSMMQMSPSLPFNSYSKLNVQQKYLQKQGNS